MQPIELPTLSASGEPALDPEQIARMQDEVRALAQERNAVILAHNYQLPEIQDVADYVGDSLGLSQRAARADEGTIAFCGVHFMAETASVLCPEKTVLIPDLDAGCSLADAITPEQLRAWQAEHPGAITVMYVNTTAEIKALTDYCVTSANAVAVVEHILREHGSETEGSGGITLETVRARAATGLDFISVGALTHSAPALDLSLLLETTS